MAKQFTRKVIVYEHTFAKVENGENGISIKDSFVFNATEKLGTKKIAALAKGDEKFKDYTLVSITQKIQTYTMDLETFLAHATLVEE